MKTTNFADGFARTGIYLATLLGLWICTPQKTQAAGMLIADGGFGGVVEIKEHQVDVTINNGIAVTTVEQVFLNQESRIVEALYTFPVPKGASVSNFSMWISGKEMIGEVVEKERAREIYESYKKRRVDPGLLEQVDYRSFEMRIFPIAANAEQRVRVTYAQELAFDHDRGRYVYPLATRTRPGTDSAVNGTFSLSLHLSSAVPLRSIESPSHPANFVTQQHTENYWEASLEQPSGSLAEDIVLNWEMTRPKTGLDLITSANSKEDGYFLSTITVGEDLEKMDEGMDYVFILDVSGSMQHERKLPVSLKSIQAFVGVLGEKDRFELMAFNIAAKTKFKQLTAPNEQIIREAHAFLSNLQAAGGTRLLPAVQAAYRYADPDRTLNVILVSDGMSNKSEDRADLMRAIRSRPANARVFCLGVGNDINRPLLEQAAQSSGGLAAFISEGDNFNQQAKAFRRKLTRPAATDLQFSVEGVEIYDTEPKELGNLYHGSPLRIYGKYKKGGEAKATISGLINGREFKVTQPLVFDKRNNDNSELERMWAWKRIDGLLKSADENGSRRPVQDEVIRLGEGYSIVTEYTSFLVLENDAAYKTWNIERRNLLRTERDRATQDKIRLAMKKMREQNVVNLGPAPALEQPTSTSQSAQPTTSPKATPTPSPSPRRSFDIDLGPAGGGSGPVGPLLLLFACKNWWDGRKKTTDKN